MMAIIPLPFISKPMEKGIIEIFAGTLASIPEGWRLCDGANGTPDLRERFVRGVATAVTEPGGTGGQDDVTITSSTISAHNHTVIAYTHSHRVNASTADGVGGVRFTNTGDEDDLSRTSSNVPPSQNLVSTGASGTHENKPPFFEIAYIMKIF